MNQDLMNFISTLGFPIVACCALFWQNNKWESRHEEESKAFREAIDNNTSAIENLISMIKGGEKN